MAPRPHLPDRYVGVHHRPGVLLALLILVALIGVAVYIAIRLANRRPAQPAAAAGAYGPSPQVTAYGRDPAVEQARLRYARGELSRDDYLRVVVDLGGEPPPSTSV